MMNMKKILATGALVCLFGVKCRQGLRKRPSNLAWADHMSLVVCI